MIKLISPLSFLVINTPSMLSIKDFKKRKKKKNSKNIIYQA